MINLWNHIRSLEERKKYIFLGIFVGGQLILFLILKFYFFGSFKANVAGGENIPASNPSPVANNFNNNTIPK